MNLIENIDFYINAEGNFVFTEKYHKDRGYCCNNNCLHCPFKAKTNSINPDNPNEIIK